MFQLCANINIIPETYQGLNRKIRKLCFKVFKNTFSAAFTPKTAFLNSAERSCRGSGVKKKIALIKFSFKLLKAVRKDPEGAGHFLPESI
jgi:hypothetical protein